MLVGRCNRMSGVALDRVGEAILHTYTRRC
jgi:hypothetical protein